MILYNLRLALELLRNTDIMVWIKSSTIDWSGQVDYRITDYKMTIGQCEELARTAKKFWY